MPAGSFFIFFSSNAGDAYPMRKAARPAEAGASDQTFWPFLGWAMVWMPSMARITARTTSSTPRTAWT